MRVLISGAGIAGSTTAYWLAQAGVQVTVVEKAAELLPHGQAVDMHGSALEVIKKMNLLEEVRKRHTKEKGSQLIDRNGRPFAPFPQDGKSLSLTSEFEILRGDLAKILYDAAKVLSDVKYLFSTTVKAVTKNDETGVTVELISGDIQTFDLLIAADGQWSKIRSDNFPSDSITVVDQNMYSAYFTVPRQPEDNDWWNFYHAPGSRIITSRPDPYGSIRTFLTHMPLNDTKKQAWIAASRGGRAAQQKLLRQEFADAGWQTQRFLDAMSESPDFYFQAISQIRMSKWWQNRIVCVGDAAYAPTPLTGEGTSLAVIGAYVLAGEIGNLQKGQRPEEALESYDRIFRPHAEKCQWIPTGFPGLAHPATAWGIWMVHTCMSVLSWVFRLPILKGKLVEDQDDGFIMPRYAAFEKEMRDEKE